jgi:hypothetical protein
MQVQLHLREDLLDVANAEPALLTTEGDPHMNSVSDRLLTLIVPRARASACPCAPDPYDQIRCGPTGLERRTCTTNCVCTVRCGPWHTLSPLC